MRVTLKVNIDEPLAWLVQVQQWLTWSVAFAVGAGLTVGLVFVFSVTDR